MEMSEKENHLEVTVAATQNSLHIFEIDGPEAEPSARWEELPKVIVSARVDERLRDVLERASAELGISVSAQTQCAVAQLRRERGEEPREETVVDHLAFAAFHCLDDDEVVNSHGIQRRNARLGSTAVAVVRDERGRAVWKRPPFEATMAELIDAADADLIEGDPLQPYLVLVIPQGELGLLAEWTQLVENLKLLWDIAGAMAQIGGAWAFLDLVRQVAKRRTSTAETIAANASDWSKRGARPDDLVALLQMRPRTSEEIGALLGCSDGEAEALLWGLGCAERDGLWHWRGDDVANFIADDLELDQMFANYRGRGSVKREFERRMRQLGEGGQAPSASSEKQQMSDEFSRKVHAEIEEELGDRLLDEEV